MPHYRDYEDDAPQSAQACIRSEGVHDALELVKRTLLGRELELAQIKYALRNAVAALDGGLLSRDDFIARIRQLGE